MTTAAPTPTAAATPSRRVLRQARFEAAGLLRHGEQLLVSVVLPALALLALAWTDVPSLGPGRRVDLATAGVLALAVVSTAFTGQAILLAFERRHGVLRLLGTTPLGRGGLLAAKGVSVLVVLAVQVVVLGGLGLALGWRPDPGGVVPALVLLLLGVAAFAALAALLGGTLRAEGVLALANLGWVLFLGLGGVVIPTGQLPDALATVVAWLPSAALGDGLRAALILGDVPLREALVLLVWAGAVGGLAARLLRWSD